MEPPNPSTPRSRRRQVLQSFAHGWARVGDPLRALQPAAPGTPRRSAPAGTSLLLMIIVVVLAGAGLARVRASTRVLALGAAITELTDEQSRLQEQKRRLLAERAYLRHPDQIAEVARGKLGMVPVAPDLVQQIRVVEERKDP
ncbi:MAG TPA: cell division protein FtsL [Nannocystaceae bacterium]|nr:cell division protein FtsL [Nannocystaceae bacterium]